MRHTLISARTAGANDLAIIGLGCLVNTFALLLPAFVAELALSLWLLFANEGPLQQRLGPSGSIARGL